MRDADSQCATCGDSKWPRKSREPACDVARRRAASSGRRSVKSVVPSARRCAGSCVARPGRAAPRAVAAARWRARCAAPGARADARPSARYAARPRHAGRRNARYEGRPGRSRRQLRHLNRHRTRSSAERATPLSCPGPTSGESVPRQGSARQEPVTRAGAPARPAMRQGPPRPRRRPRAGRPRGPSSRRCLRRDRRVATGSRRP